jgi:hypothetical protein
MQRAGTSVSLNHFSHLHNLIISYRWYEKEDFAAPGTTGPDDGHESASSDESY